MWIISNYNRISSLTKSERENSKWEALAKNFNIYNHNKIPNLLAISYKLN